MILFQRFSSVGAFESCVVRDSGRENVETEFLNLVVAQFIQGNFENSMVSR